MTIVVLLFLAVIWAAVLVPPALRARAEGRPADSIGSFRRQLHVLERTGPTTVTPAHRLFHGARPTGPAAIGLGLGYGPRTVGGGPLSLRTAPLGAQSLGGVGRRPSATMLARKRRRDIFLGLLVAMGGSLVLGFLPPLRLLWAAHLLLDVAFVAYVALLLRMRNLAAERDLKVRFLPTSRSGEPTLALHRSAAN